MWIFTVHGFYSAVCARHQSGPNIGRPDPSLVMVRVRVVDHLRNLQRRFPELAELPIKETANTDYAARLFVPKAQWVACLATLMAEVDYDNFKSAVGAKHLTDAAYKSRLHGVWSEMYALQRGRSGGSVSGTFHFDDAGDEQDDEHSGAVEHWRGQLARAGAKVRGRESNHAPAQKALRSKLKAAQVALDARFQMSNEARALRVSLNHFTDDTPVLVLKHTDGRGLLVLANTKHYSEGRTALRDAVALGALAPIAREDVTFTRTTALQAWNMVEPGVDWLDFAEMTPGEVSKLACEVCRMPLATWNGPCRNPRCTQLNKVRVKGSRRAASPAYDARDGNGRVPPVSQGELMSEDKPGRRVIEATVNITAPSARAEIDKTAPRPAPLVEDTSVVGGVDAQSGAPVVRPRAVDGRADEGTVATDPQERR